MRRSILVLIFVLGISAGPAWAADKRSTPLTRLDDATKSMMEGLDENQLRQFAAIRNSHGIIRAVENRKAYLDSAVKNCSKLNPDLADPIRGRYNAWTGTIDPILDEARQRMNMMIKLQDFGKPEQARGYLKKIDDAVAYKARGVVAEPIGSHDECEDLIETLDETEKPLKKSLIENLGLNKQIVQEEQ